MKKTIHPTLVCGAPAMGGSPKCELPKPHAGRHQYIEFDTEANKERTYTWGPNVPARDVHFEERLWRALEVLLYVAEQYKSPAVKEALKELLSEDFEP